MCVAQTALSRLFITSTFMTGDHMKSFENPALVNGMNVYFVENEGGTVLHKTTPFLPHNLGLIRPTVSLSIFLRLILYKLRKMFINSSCRLLMTVKYLGTHLFVLTIQNSFFCKFRNNVHVSLLIFVPKNGRAHLFTINTNI